MAGLLDFLPTKEGLLSGYNRVNGLLEDAVRYTDPKRFVSASDVASGLPGGGLVTAWQESGKGRDALKAGDYAGAAGAYGNMLLNMVPEGGAIAKLAALIPGAAVRAWHGSPAAFDKFDINYAGSKTDPGMMGKAHYFSTDPVVAEGTTDKFGTYGAAPHKYEAEITLKNPLNLEMKDWSADKRKLVSDALGIPYSKDEPFTKEWAQKVSDELKKRGHDGVALDYSPVGYNHHEIAVLDDAPIDLKRRY